MESALRLGLTYAEAQALPLGEVQDLATCYQVMNNGWKQKKTRVYENDIPDLR